MYNRYVLNHYGVLGMKWGVRKQRASAYRKKIQTIRNQRDFNDSASDGKRLKYRDQHVAKRIVQTAALATAQVVISDIFSGSGKMLNPATMSRAEQINAIKKISVKTATKFAMNEALAKSTVNKYDDKGRRKKGTSDEVFTREDLIRIGARAGVRAVPVLNYMAGKKAYELRTERSKNEAVFTKWGENVLPQKISDVVWRSEDLQTTITDPRR